MDSSYLYTSSKKYGQRYNIAANMHRKVDGICCKYMICEDSGCPPNRHSSFCDNGNGCFGVLKELLSTRMFSGWCVADESTGNLIVKMEE